MRAVIPAAPHRRVLAAMTTTQAASTRWSSRSSPMNSLPGRLTRAASATAALGERRKAQIVGRVQRRRKCHSDDGGGEDTPPDHRVQRGAVSASAVNALFFHPGVLEDVQSPGVRRRHPVFDTVVDHLHEMTGAVGAALEIAPLGSPVTPFAPGRLGRRSRSRSEGREDRIEPAHHQKDEEPRWAGRMWIGRSLKRG